MNEININEEIAILEEKLKETKLLKAKEDESKDRLIQSRNFRIICDCGKERVLTEDGRNDGIEMDVDINCNLFIDCSCGKEYKRNFWC